MWGKLSYEFGASCLRASLKWGELSWGELSLGRVVCNLSRARDVMRVSKLNRHWNRAIRNQNCSFFCLPIRHIRLGLTCPAGIRILFLLEDSAFKNTPSYDEVKNKFFLTFKNKSFSYQDTPPLRHCAHFWYAF